MTFSLKRIQAIFMKDWKDLMKNSYILFTLAIPLAFAAWLGRIGNEDAFLQSMPVNLALVISGCFVQAAMVAEEKEKNTLRGLLLSPASTMEILVGKSVLTGVLTIVIIIGSILLSGFQVSNAPVFSLLILLNLIVFIAIGTTIGLVSRTVMETSIVGMPVMIIFGMGTMFKTMIENESIINLINYLPGEQMNSAWLAMSNGSDMSSIAGNIFVLLAWCVVALVITFITYGKRRFDK